MLRIDDKLTPFEIQTIQESINTFGLFRTAKLFPRAFGLTTNDFKQESSVIPVNSTQTFTN